MSKLIFWLIAFALFISLFVVLVAPIPTTDSVVSQGVAASGRGLMAIETPINYLRGELYTDLSYGLNHPAVAQTGSIVFLLFSGLFALVAYLIHESSWLLLIDWILGVTAWNIGRKRAAKNVFTIRNSISRQPIGGAEISVIRRGQSVARFHSDIHGRVYFSWPMQGEKVKLRISRTGYRSEIVVLDAEIEDIPLEPLVHGLSFHLSHTLRVAHTTALLLGTALLAPIVLTTSNNLVLLTIIGYLFLWVRYLQSSIKPFHLAQVVDYRSRKPIAYARVVTYQGNAEQKHLCDDNGLLRIPYPIPERVMVAKPGFHTETKRIPISAISSDILIVTMQPQE